MSRLPTRRNKNRRLGFEELHGARCRAQPARGRCYGWSLQYELSGPSLHFYRGEGSSFITPVRRFSSNLAKKQTQTRNIAAFVCWIFIQHHQTMIQIAVILGPRLRSVWFVPCLPVLFSSLFVSTGWIMAIMNKLRTARTPHNTANCLLYTSDAADE